jgi:CRP/FNR family cyclic AMP-dependent transcriptional regulator
VSSQDVARSLAAAPFLGDLSSDVIEGLADRGRVRTYRRGTYLSHKGDPAPDVFFLIEGRVEISSESANGNRILHTAVEPPQFFGELAVLGDIPRTASVLAVQDSQVWTLPAEDFIEFLAAQPVAALSILRTLARQVQAHESFVDDLLFLDLKGRVAKRLLQLVSPSLESLPADGVALPSIITHADLASMCGGSRENVTRVLSEFQRRGLVDRDGRRYVLTKIAGLAKLAGL